MTPETKDDGVITSPLYRMARVWGRMKISIKGKKRYRCMLEYDAFPIHPGRKLRTLRNSQQTATAAMVYGEEVSLRYHRLCDLAITQAMAQVQSG